MVIPMIRFCLSVTVCVAVAFGSLGCSGQNIEGRWLGPLPIEDAKACRIDIYSDHRFAVACGKADWVGAGSYERSGSQLELKFQTLVRHEQVLKRPPAVHLEFEGHGNTLKIRDSGSKDFSTWNRQRL